MALRKEADSRKKGGVKPWVVRALVVEEMSTEPGMSEPATDSLLMSTTCLDTMRSRVFEKKEKEG